MQNLLGVQNAGNEGAAKILDFDLFSQNRPPLKLNSKNILSYGIFLYEAPLRPCKWTFLRRALTKLLIRCMK